MILFIVTSIVFFCTTVILGFTTFNLLRKHEKQEDINSVQEKILLSYMEYISKIDEIIGYSDERLKVIDSKGTFKSDDEIGWFFEQVKLIQETLNNFKIRKV